jgi:hypothetical protein
MLADAAPLRGAVAPPLVSPGAGKREPLAVPGAVMRGSLDLTHPFTFGFGTTEIGVLLSGADFYGPSREGANPVAFVGENLRVTGFVWPENTERLLRGTAWMVDEPIGEGRVVLFADDPNYRMLWPFPQPPAAECHRAWAERALSRPLECGASMENAAGDHWFPGGA